MASNDPLIGTQLGDYKIESVLGQGGMARVYRGYDERLARYAAVKVIEPNLVASEDEEEYRERFQREARAIARLNHPRVVGIFQFGQIENLYYMAMGFVEGRDLRQILKEYGRQKKRLSNEQILTIIRDTAEALDYSHQQGVIHRDVKPSNMMVTADGHSVLTDFGLALNAQEGTIGNTFGSVHYIAPEQAVSSAQAVTQSDLYSLGVVLFEMLTGRVPFEDVSAMSVALKHISDAPPLPSSINPDIPPEVEKVILKLLDKDPENRYQTGAELIKALEPALMSNAKKKADEPILMPANKRDAADGDMEDKPTISDSSRDKPGSLPFAPIEEAKATKAGSNTMMYAGAAIVGVIIIIAAIIVLGSGGDDGEEATPTATAVAVTEEATEDESSTTVAVIETQEPATDEPEPTDVTEDSATVAVDSLTDEPTEEPEITATPILSAADSTEAQVLLRYDGRSLVLYNRSPSATIDVSGLSFVRISASGSTTTFRASEWGVDTASDIQAEDCLQVWTVAFNNLQATDFPAEICRFRQAFRQTSRAFWTSSNPEVIFEVRRGSVVLATCPTVRSDNLDETRCLVEIRNSGGEASLGAVAQASTATPSPPAITVAGLSPTPSPQRPKNTPQSAFNVVSSTSTPELDANTDDTAEALLRYDGRSLVLYNRSGDQQIDVSRLSFILRGSSGSETEFDASEWGGDNLTGLSPAHCYQVWTTAYVNLLASDFPAEICASRTGFRQTSRAFWVNDGGDGVFKVTRGGQILATCPAIAPDNEVEIRCLVDLTPSGEA